MFNKLKFFFKKLNIKEADYDCLIYNASRYDEIVSCIKIDINTNTEHVAYKSNQKFIEFIKSREYIVNLNIKEFFTAAGFTFDKSVKFNIETNMD